MFRNGIIAFAIIAAIIGSAGIAAAKKLKMLAKAHLEQIEEISGSSSKTEILESKDSSPVLEQYEK